MNDIEGWYEWMKKRGFYLLKMKEGRYLWWKEKKPKIRWGDKEHKRRTLTHRKLLQFHLLHSNLSLSLSNSSKNGIYIAGEREDTRKKRSGSLTTDSWQHCCISHTLCLCHFLLLFSFFIDHFLFSIFSHVFLFPSLIQCLFQLCISIFIFYFYFFNKLIQCS